MVVTSSSPTLPAKESSKVSSIYAVYCMVIGIFWAAIYMCTGNLLLSMCLHALTDLTPRIVGYLFVYDTQPAISSFISVARDVIDYVIFPILSILICIFYDRIKNLKKVEN